MPLSPAQRKRDQRARARHAVDSGAPLADVSTAGLVDLLLSLIATEHERLPCVLIELGRRGGASLRRKRP